MKNLMLSITVAVFILLSIIGCKESTLQDKAGYFNSYKEIPGVTAEEIKAIEKLKTEVDTFVYALVLSTEAFFDSQKGEIKGFSALFSEWMTKLGIPFKPINLEWGAILSGLEDYTVDFAGDITPTEDRLKKYYMTAPIARRTLRYFRIAGAAPFSEIAKVRPLRFAMLGSSVMYDYIASSRVHDDFEPFYIYEASAAYELLKSGQVDAYIDENNSEAVFDIYDDVVGTDYFPLRYNSVSLTTQNPALEPIISVVQKAIKNDNMQKFLTEIYEKGELEYRQHKFYIMLTEEEKEYIQKNPVIPFVAEHYNYPISFYNKYEKQWQGIYFDVIEKVTEFTGITFNLLNDQKVEWAELLKMLTDGEAYMLSELIPTQQRKDAGFNWSKVPSMVDNYALLSKSETPNISLKNVANVSVALPKNTAYSEVFENWFPNHQKTKYYDGSNAATEALYRGETDMVMLSQRRLLAITNYHEYPGYKTNLVFDYPSESLIGFNKDQAVLASIFGKVMQNIDIKSISEQWALKTYDYKGKIAKEQRPWLIGALVSILCALLLLFVLFMRNHSEGRRLEDLVQKRTTELKAANNAKSIFLANMSHEIRTPMNAIIGMTELALREELPSAAQKQIVTAKRSAGNLLAIINDILDFSKIESGKMEIIPVSYSFSTLVNDVMGIIKTRITNPEIQFISNIDDKIPDSLFGDETRIRQVLLNILSNAVKYTKKGSIYFEIIGKILRDEKVILTINVIDTGKGIKEEDVKKLGGDFVQLDLAANRGVEGTGLGLAITKNLLKLMGGYLEFSSIYGKGSKFTIILPQKINSQESMAKVTEKNEDLSEDENKEIMYFNAPNAKILVVDDNEVNLAVAEGLMFPYGMQLDLCTNGKEAIEKVKENDYDICFMDHMMPEMDGIEAAKYIKEFDSDLPIIALTANAVSGMKEMFLENGFDDFLSKPIDTRKLNGILKKWIAVY